MCGNVSVMQATADNNVDDQRLNVGDPVVHNGIPHDEWITDADSADSRGTIKGLHRGAYAQNHSHRRWHHRACRLFVLAWSGELTLEFHNRFAAVGIRPALS